MSVSRDAASRSARNTRLVGFGTTMILFLIPFAIYAYQRMEGQLPSYAEWETSRSNHGPWRETGMGLLVFLPFLVLVPVTAALGLAQAVEQHSWLILRSVVVVTCVQIVAALLQLFYLYWLVD